jgi:hypothetical protein
MQTGLESPNGFRVRARFGRNAEDRYVNAVIAGYFDDSSDPNMAEFVCSGGIVEDEFKVAALETRWREETKMLSEPLSLLSIGGRGTCESRLRDCGRESGS